MGQSKENQSNKIFIAIAVTVSIVIMGILGVCIYALMQNDEVLKQNKKVIEKNAEVIKENQGLIKEGQVKDARLNTAYRQVDSMRNELGEMRNELGAMSDELDNKILKTQELGGKVDRLLLLKAEIEAEKQALKQRTDQQISRLQGTMQSYKALLQSQKALLQSQDIKIDSLQTALLPKLKISGMNVLAISTSGEEKNSPFTNRHIDTLKIQFNVLQSQVAFGEKKILVKIKDYNNNVIFDLGSNIFKDRQNHYSIKQYINYQGSELRVTFLYTKGTDYTLGRHKIEIYTDDYKMGEGVFVVSR